MSFVFGSNSASTGYNLTRSLRFRRSASGYLSRTAGAGNQQIMTLSFWFKRGMLGVAQYIFGSYSGGSAFSNLYIESTNQIGFADAASATNLLSTQVFRDPSAWYHIVVAIDTTQATAANRVKFYVNNVQITAFASSTYPAQNTNLNLNSAVNHTLFNNAAPAATNYTDGYLAETNFVNAQQLTPSSFGSTNALTGVWQPARYTGSYGTNGFYLPFTDNSALTTSSNVGLGKDFSGNANYWVTNNISITAGVTYDSMTDVPTLTSATAANFAVGNPLAAQLASVWNIATMQAGNLNWGSAADNQNKVGMATMSMTSGKYYWEITIGSNFPAASTFLGITKENQQSVSKNTGVYYRNDGQKVIDSTSSAYGASYTSGDVIGLAYDATAGTLVCYKNNSSQGTLYSSGTGFSWIPTMSCDNAGSGVTYFNNVNFGQRPFSYTPPTGFVALNTFNLPTSTIVKGNTVMDATLWAGNSSTQSITNAASFQPNFVWIKNRTGANSHALFDSVRGATKRLYSDATLAEQTEATTLTAFNSNGFSVSSSGAVNASANSYVGWQWLESASAGFDIVTFTGNGGGQTFSHNLGVAPGLMICKSLNNAQDWYVYHSSIGGTGALSLNTTAATATSVNYWSNVTPGSSTFSVGGNFSSGYTYVNYLFAPIAGFSAFGSYTGNGSADGPFIYTGFRPRWVMFKDTVSASQWRIWDTARDPYNITTNALYANSSGTEQSADNYLDIVSNGFKIRSTNAGVNTNAGNYIYMAFAENPFKNALAR